MRTVAFSRGQSEVQDSMLWFESRMWKKKVNLEMPRLSIVTLSRPFYPGSSHQAGATEAN